MNKMPGNIPGRARIAKIWQTSSPADLEDDSSGYNQQRPRDPNVWPKEKSMSGLAARKCVPCREGVPPLKGEELTPLLKQLSGWEVINEQHLSKEYRFPDFATALAFVNRVGRVAEAEGHHPDVSLSWGRVGIRIWTHKIDGLTESDFILAAKIDALPSV
jgi:4a-hydroxytetrahydrobiopterin dehydratase